MSNSFQARFCQGEHAERSFCPTGADKNPPGKRSAQDVADPCRPDLDAATIPE
jgi:hypothetical protein